jgi:hypothetical protein
MKRGFVCQVDFTSVLRANDMSGLLLSPLEVTDETDGDATGDPEDAI